MNKEVISDRQGIALVALYILGTNLIMGVSTISGRDVWISILLAVAFIIPVIAMYSRILKLHPNKTFYEIVEVVLGKFFGKIVILLFSFYAFLLCSLILNIFTLFIRIVAMPETPEIASILVFGILVIWTVKVGIESIGRLSKNLLTFIIVQITFMSILALNEGSIRNLRPMFYNGFAPVLENAINIFTFPFAEICVFLTILRFIAGRCNPKKIFYYGLTIGGSLLLLIITRGIFVIGEHLTRQLYFPSYTLIGLIEVGGFLQRIEVFILIAYLFSGYVKMSLCLIAASKGLDSIFNLGDYKKIVAPLGFLSMIISNILYESVSESIQWSSSVYQYFAPPFQIIIPMVVWIVAEVKIKKQKIQKSSVIGQ